MLSFLFIDTAMLIKAATRKRAVEISLIHNEFRFKPIIKLDAAIAI